MTFGSLFAGVGGFDLGLERAGLTCAWQVEKSGFCRAVLAKHWPAVRRWDDIRTFPPALPADWRADVIVGGDPCQGNSNANSVHKTAHDDLGGEFVRVVRLLRPRVVVRENPARTRPDALWPWWRMRTALVDAGYRVLPFRLRACCVGADHERDRLFLLAEPVDADGLRLAGLDRQGVQAEHAGRTTGGHGRPERWDNGLSRPRVLRSRRGVPDYVDRITALGNAVDVRVAEWIGRRLAEWATNG